jgi:glutamate synthase domain-containing protein 1
MYFRPKFTTSTANAIVGHNGEINTLLQYQSTTAKESSLAHPNSFGEQIEALEAHC